MDDHPLPIKIGGLFRCCLATYDQLAPVASATKEGDTLTCSYCDDGRMVVRNGVWEWDH
jgi:hypothetical protein